MKNIFIIDVIWVCICSILGWNIWAITHNTLENNGKWVSTKYFLKKGVIAGNAYFTEVQTLKDNRLHLESWHGYNEVFTKESYNFSEVSFDAIFSKDSYLYFEFNTHEDEVPAIRISANTLFPTAIITMKKSGEFTLIDYFNSPILLNKKTRVKIQYIPEHSVIKLYINDRVTKEFPIGEQFYSPIGFRGGLQAVAVSNVAILDKDGRSVFTENFTYANSFLFPRYILFSIFIVFVSILLRRYFCKYTKRRTISLCAFQVITLSLLMILYFMINTFIVGKYPNTDGIFSFYWSKKEADIKRKNVDFVSNAIQSLPRKTIYRIVFIGSSQTWGAGATEEDKTIVSTVCRLLNSDPSLVSLRTVDSSMPTVETSMVKRKENIECINTAISGVDSTELLKRYKLALADHLDPDMLVINLSNNDRNQPDEFALNLQKFKEASHANTKIVFVQEANSAESSKDVIKNHSIMKNIGDSLNISVIDLHNFLLTQNAKGILWWDFVHLTDFGHEVAGKYLTTKIKDMRIYDNARR